MGSYGHDTTASDEPEGQEVPTAAADAPTEGEDTCLAFQVTGHPAEAVGRSTIAQQLTERLGMAADTPPVPAPHDWPSKPLDPKGYGLLRHALDVAAQVRPRLTRALTHKEGADSLLNRYAATVRVVELEATVDCVKLDQAEDGWWEIGIPAGHPEELRHEEIMERLSWYALGRPALPAETGDRRDDWAFEHLMKAQEVFVEAFLAGGQTVLAPFRVLDPARGKLVCEIGLDEHGYPLTRLFGKSGAVAVSLGTDSSDAAYVDVHDHKGRSIATLCQGGGGMLALYADRDERSEDDGGAELYLTVDPRAQVMLRNPGRDNPYDLTLIAGDEGEFIAASKRPDWWRDPSPRPAPTPQQFDASIARGVAAAIAEHEQKGGARLRPTTYSGRVAEARRLALELRQSLGIMGEATYADTSRMADAVGLPDGSDVNPHWETDCSVLRTPEGWWPSGDSRISSDPHGKYEDAALVVALAVAHYLLNPLEFAGYGRQCVVPEDSVTRVLHDDVQNLAEEMVRTITSEFIETWDGLKSAKREVEA